MANSFLFIPQARHIYKLKSAQGVSLTSFVGFWLIQSIFVIHGIIFKDYFLAGGYLLSMITCDSVIFFAIYYKKGKEDSLEGAGLALNEVMKQLPGHVYWKSKSGVTLWCNTHTWSTLGFSSLHDIVGKTDYDIFTKEQADSIARVDNQVMRTGKGCE